MVTRILLFLLGVFALTWMPCEAAEAADSVAAAAKRLAAFTDGFYLEDKPGAGKALNNFWTEAQRWSVDYLNAHPKASPAEIETAAPLIEKEKPFAVEDLAPGLFAISARYVELGNVFLVGKREGHFAVLWDIRNGGSAEGWRTADALSDAKLNRRAMAGVVHRLPPDATGHIRFYLESVYAQPAGGTRGGQLSFWRWNGKTAARLLTKNYAFNDDEPVRVERDLVTIRSKTVFKTLAAYGCCDGRQLDWTFRIGSHDVRNLGETLVTPELDVVDGLFARMAKGQTTNGVADKAAVAALRPLVEHGLRYNNGNIDVGFLRDSAVRHDQTGAKLCLTLEPTNSTPLRLELHLRPNRLIDAAVIDLGNDCRSFAGKAP